MTTPRRFARFEIVRTDAGFHARFRAGNGRIIWTTEVYERRGKAVRAVELICDEKVTASPFANAPEVAWAGSEYPTEVRDVDERGSAS